jgi:hypothetical protein
MSSQYDPKWGKIFWVFVALVILSVAVALLRSHLG